MGFGYHYSGVSGDEYEFLIIDATNLEALPMQGGLIAVVEDDFDKPVFIGAAENIREAFTNIKIWSKYRKLPAGKSYLIRPYDEKRYEALNDLLDAYAPPLNDSF